MRQLENEFQNNYKAYSDPSVLGVMFNNHGSICIQLISLFCLKTWFYVDNARFLNFQSDSQLFKAATLLTLAVQGCFLYYSGHELS